MSNNQFFNNNNYNQFFNNNTIPAAVLAEQAVNHAHVIRRQRTDVGSQNLNRAARASPYLHNRQASRMPNNNRLGMQTESVIPTPTYPLFHQFRDHNQYQHQHQSHLLQGSTQYATQYSTPNLTAPYMYNAMWASNLNAYAHGVSNAMPFAYPNWSLFPVSPQPIASPETMAVANKKGGAAQSASPLFPSTSESDIDLELRL